MSFPSGPGKTAPKLCQDFLNFDPLKAHPNILTNQNPPVGDGVRWDIPAGSCKHDYTIKAAQSLPPPLDLRPDGTTRHKLGLCCKRCRLHAEVAINYAGSTNPCPTSDFPLHDFQRLISEDLSTRERIRFGFLCSAPECHALLHIDYRLPRLSEQEIDLLTNTELLKKRCEEMLRKEPVREGIRQATPIDALSRLRKYVKDGLSDKLVKPKINANNKRFMEICGWYGQDCKELLGRLGFVYTEEDDGGCIWALPDPSPLPDRLQTDGSSQREALEDVEIELTAWMYKIASETGAINPAAAEGWHSAIRDIERTLAAQGYPRHAALRRVTSANDQLLYFTSLGALPDFSDTLVEFAFDRQIHCDPASQAYYFECLQVITEFRGTEQLHMKVATLQSQDLVSRRDLSAAYRTLGVAPAAGYTFPDERILELYQARQIDLGENAAEDARHALNRIGTARQSQMILRASHQTIETYADALAWLGNGVDNTTPDEGILAVLAIKTSETAANEEIGQKVVSVIAKARQSNMLNNWLLTGRSDGYQMGVDEALRHLNIDQSLEAVDQTMWPVIFDAGRSDRPGETTEKAIATIEAALANLSTNSSHTAETWPVGLTSHGNTCYLNSLLQYYFSIKPLRDIVLSYDRYKLDTSTYEKVPDARKEARVGGLQVELVVIKGGQRFAEDLKHLFERMIKEPGTAVKPEEDLVCRAFLHPKDYALLSSSIREQAVIANGTDEAVDDKVADQSQQSDASSVTVRGDESDTAMKDSGMPPTPPASPGQHAQDVQPEPTHAPPLPPRRYTTSKEEALSRAQEKARQQQDVTEVHDAVMFRLRSGMTPDDVDQEEQVDAVREIFNIGMTETLINNGVVGKSKAISDSTIQLNVPNEPIDIYSALDDFFDPEAIAERPELETFRSIRHLPPILQISIPRIGYGPAGAFKSEHSVRLEDELYVDRYCEIGDPQILPKRKACWGWRKQLRALRKDQKALAQTSVGLDGPATVAETAKFLDSLGEVDQLLESVGVDPINVDEHLSHTLQNEAHLQSSLAADLETRITELRRNLDRQFADTKALKYRLAAVFIHRGTHGHGHYWIYIHDFTHNLWRLYNDERVEEFKKLDDIFEAKTWEQGTPTYAVYVMDQYKELYVQPVCRAPEPVPVVEEEPWTNVEARDVPMDDVGTVQHADTNMVVEGGVAEWDDSSRKVADVEW